MEVYGVRWVEMPGRLVYSARDALWALPYVSPLTQHTYLPAVIR